MSRFDQRFAAMAAPRLLEHQGQAMSYLPSAGAAIAVTGILELAPVPELRAGPDGQVLVRTGTVQLLASEVSGAGPRDRIRIGSDVWDVVSVDAAEAGMITAHVQRVLQTERSGQGYRMNR